MEHLVLDFGLALALIGIAVSLAAKLRLSNVPFLILIGMAVGPHAPQIGIFDFRFISSAPHAPIPPALATDADRDVGEAPAIGASNTGKRIPSRAAKSSARETEFLVSFIANLRSDICLGFLEQKSPPRGGPF